MAYTLGLSNVTTVSNRLYCKTKVGDLDYNFTIEGQGCYISWQSAKGSLSVNEELVTTAMHHGLLQNELNYRSSTGIFRPANISFIQLVEFLHSNRFNLILSYPFKDNDQNCECGCSLNMIFYNISYTREVMGAKKIIAYAGLTPGNDFLFHEPYYLAVDDFKLAPKYPLSFSDQRIGNSLNIWDIVKIIQSSAHHTRCARQDSELLELLTTSKFQDQNIKKQTMQTWTNLYSYSLVNSIKLFSQFKN